jgi:hypothetical protein
MPNDENGAGGPSQPAPGAGPAGPGPGASLRMALFDVIRLHALVYEEAFRIQHTLITSLLAPVLRPNGAAQAGATSNGTISNGTISNGAAHAGATSNGAGVAPPAAAVDPPADSASPDDVAALLAELQLLFLKFPVAAQAGYRALVAEGRGFAKTPEGAAWAQALGSSELVQQGRRIWDTVSLGMFDEDPSTVIPSAYLEVLLRAAKSTTLEDLLRRIVGAAAAGGPAGAHHGSA